MRIGILETVKTNAGFELEFDRIIIEELKKQGHEPILLLPEKSELNTDFGVPIDYLSGGQIVDYTEAGKIKKIILSVKRESRRVNWFDSAYNKIKDREFEAIIITTATYRYLRSLRRSLLKNSPIPVILIFLGVNPQEKPKFLTQARKCLPYKNIKLKITTLRDDFASDKLPNMDLILPPVVVPPDMIINRNLNPSLPLKIGFFGHYRKGEKDLNGILQAFKDANLNGFSELLVQAVASTENDKQDLDAIVKKFSDVENIKFIHDKYIGDDWYSLLNSVDIIFLPYSAERYLYNWSAVYFNAIGLFKPVLVTTRLNPEVLKRFEIGVEVDVNDLHALKETIVKFVAEYGNNAHKYEVNLIEANKLFAHSAFIRNLLA